MPLPLPPPSSGSVIVLGDALAHGQRDWTSMPPRIAEALPCAWVGLDFTGVGGITAAYRKLPEIQQQEAAIGVLLLGTEDAQAQPHLRSWMTMWRQCFRALWRNCSVVIVVLPPEPLKEGQAVKGYEKNARRWVRRIQQEIPKAVQEEVGDMPSGWSRVIIVDADSILTDEALWADRVWLKPSGYEALSEAIAGAMVKRWKT